MSDEKNYYDHVLYIHFTCNYGTREYIVIFT